MPSFKDIGKAANDLFDDGEYALSREVDISANEDGVSLNATTTLESNGDVCTEVEYSQGNVTVNLDTNANQSVTYDNLKFSNMKAKMKFARNAANAEKKDTLEATVKCSDYGIELKVKGDADMNVKTDLSYAFAKDALTAGFKFPFDASKGFDASKINVGLQYAQGSNTFALKSSNPLNQQVSLSFLRSINSDFSAALGVNYSPDAAKDGCGGNMFNVGGSYNFDAKSSINGFVTGAGSIRAKYAYAFSKRMNASAQFGTTISDPFSISTGFRLAFN